MPGNNSVTPYAAKIPAVWSAIAIAELAALIVLPALIVLTTLIVLTALVELAALIGLATLRNGESVIPPREIECIAF